MSTLSKDLFGDRVAAFFNFGLLINRLQTTTHCINYHLKQTWVGELPTFLPGLRRMWPPFSMKSDQAD